MFSLVGVEGGEVEEAKPKVRARADVHEVMYNKLKTEARLEVQVEEGKERRKGKEIILSCIIDFELLCKIIV